MNQAEYAAHIDRSQQYVSRMVREGKIPVASDGSIDPVAADQARNRNTNLFRGEVRHRRRQARQARQVRSAEPSTPISALLCDGCGGHYVEKYSRNYDTPDRSSFFIRQARYNDTCSSRSQFFRAFPSVAIH